MWNNMLDRNTPEKCFIEISPLQSVQDNMNIIQKIERFQLPLSVFKCIKPNLVFINVYNAMQKTERKIKSVPIF